MAGGYGGGQKMPKLSPETSGAGVPLASCWRTPMAKGRKNRLHPLAGEKSI